MRASGPPRDHDHVLEEVGALLRSHGLRRTPQREATLEAVAEAEGHATAEEIVARVRRTVRGVSPSTVYRTLGTLEKVGILCHAHLGHSASVYHVGSAALHQHLVCERCGRIVEVEPDATAGFGKQMEKRFGFRPDFTHFAVLGECGGCARRRVSRRRAPGEKSPSRARTSSRSRG